MADEEVDIDIDIDIDGDDSDNLPGGKFSAVSNAKDTELPTAIHVEADGDQYDSIHGANMEDSRKSARADSVDPDSLADEFQIPDWVAQDYHSQVEFDAGDMDPKSRAMIESMLAEEQFYSGRPSLEHSSIRRDSDSTSRVSHLGSQHGSTVLDSHAQSNNIRTSDKHRSQDTKKRKISRERSGQTKRTASEDSRLNAKLSSADLPSHNTRWTSEEDERLLQGIMPHDISTNTSDGEGLDRRSSANSGEEDSGVLGTHKRRPRSKHIKRIEASAITEIDDFTTYSRHGRRARSITSESGNEEFTGSEFGATSGYDTDNDDDRSASKSPSLSARGGSRSGSTGLTTPSPGLRPLFAASPLPYSALPRKSSTFSMDEDEDEDVDIEIESTDEDLHPSLERSSPLFTLKAKSRSISPFSNSSNRSRLSSEFDSDSDQDMRERGGVDLSRSHGSQKRLSALSPAFSDTIGSPSDIYTTPNFNTSTSSVNSNGGVTISKPLLKDTQNVQRNSSQQHEHIHSQFYKSGLLGHIAVEKLVNSPKEKRTVSFGAVHVAELQPDLNSYDEDEVNSSEDGGTDINFRPSMDPIVRPSPLSASFQYTVMTKGLLDNGEASSISLSKANIIEVSTLENHIQGAIINGIVAKNVQSDQGSDEDNEDEGQLGTGMKQGSNNTMSSSFSRKARRMGGSRQKLSADDSGLEKLSASVRSISTAGSSSMTSTAASTTHSIRLRVLDKSIITEEERLVHSEFFCNKASKTPERYQRIRNTIIQAWEKSPSTYLTKTSVRSGLKDCGDVNAIGRVHSWLESIGAINVGMTASSPGASLARPRNGGNNSSKRRGHSEERGWSSSSSSSTPRRNNNESSSIQNPDSTWTTSSIRRRRVRNDRGEWVDERELAGHVIEHNVHTNSKSERQPSRKNNPSDDLFSLDDNTFIKRHGITKEEMEEELEQERLAAQNAKYFAETELIAVNNRVPKNRRAHHLLRMSQGSNEYPGEDTNSTAYDPFRLVPLSKFNVENPAPFRVKVSSDAMLIMDFHSHMAETEVIGLLGGLYDEDERILFILGVFPCRSISTGLQCEMDPESDVEARYFFSSKGFVVVGWYHSHPTFEPNPSIRDIENQCDHQAMFRRQGTGVEPFVGVIISPFDPRNLSYLSKFQFLAVSEKFDDRLNCRIPFRFDREITRMNELSVSVFQQLSEMVRYYRSYEHKVDLSYTLHKGDKLTRLDKLLRSLNHHIFVDEGTARAFLSKVKELIVRGFHLNMETELQANFNLASNTQPVQPLIESTSVHLPKAHLSPTLNSKLTLPLSFPALEEASDIIDSPMGDDRSDSQVDIEGTTTGSSKESTSIIPGDEAEVKCSISGSPSQ
ncbi:hypothetical protein BGZ76_006527 [Entomortierella beljakovae]|nr:hypothetical protein BGZ76_006527 [Entomortierella beljakovae]